MNAIPLRDLIQSSAVLHRGLEKVYDLLPVTQCRRQLRCCSLLPEMTFLEALGAMEVMRTWPSTERARILKKLVRYFFCNALEISTCPFLRERECLIYTDRFFGCRAYGLWSRDYYQKLADQNRQGKKILRQQWEKLGITLPGKVLSFGVPYCPQVKTDPPVEISDERLSAAWEKIESLSGGLNPWDQEFRERYFSDLSYFLAGLQFGAHEAVRLKFFIVRDIIQRRDRLRLERALSRVTDPFS